MAQRWYQKASVQTAIVTGFVLVIVTTIPLALQVPKLKDKNEELQRKLQERDAQIQAKDSEIQRLETLLVPFKTIALERFTGDETEALGKLADRIKTLEDQIGEVARLKAIGVPVAGVQKTTIHTFTVKGEEENEGLRPRYAWT